MRLRQDRTIDFSKPGSALVAGAAMTYAVRTARREIVNLDPHCANQETHAEIDYAVQMAACILAVAMPVFGVL